MNATDVVLLYHLSNNYSYGAYAASLTTVSVLFFLLIYISPVNKPHLLRPATRAPARTYTHGSRQSRTLTFTHQHLTKGHEGSSFKLIHLI